MTTKKNLPNVWNKAKTNDIPEGAMCINTNEPDKLKIFQDNQYILYLVFHVCKNQM